MAVWGSSGFWMFLTGVFALSTIGIASFMIYKELKDSYLSEEEQILAEHPTYFRTVEEQAEVEKEYEEMVANETKVAAPVNLKYNVSCDFYCYNQGFNGQASRKRRALGYYMGSKQQRLLMSNKRDTPVAVEPHRMKRRQTVSGTNQDIFHACCISEHYFVDPVSGVTSSGLEVEIVQFGASRQYFSAQKCTQAQGCSGCTCALEQTFASAVVRFKGTGLVGVTLVKMPGCCKCFNSLNNSRASQTISNIVYL